MTHDHPSRDDSRGCSICGGPATAYWEGTRRVEVCPRCASDVLPLIIADAITCVSRESAAATEQRVRAAFYRGLMLRLLREHDQRGLGGTNDDRR